MKQVYGAQKLSAPLFNVVNFFTEMLQRHCRNFLSVQMKVLLASAICKCIIFRANGNLNAAYTHCKMYRMCFIQQSEFSFQLAIVGTHDNTFEVEKHSLRRLNSSP
jgi:hypothetical protein